MTRYGSYRALTVDLHGYGQVGRAFLELLPQRGIRLGTVRDRRGVRLHRPAGRGERILVDATSPQYEGNAAEAWVRRLEKALVKGTPVVTCNKAPFAIAWTRLVRAARRGGATISCSGTVGGGTPVLLFLYRLHHSQGIKRIDAALNTTLGYVCSQVTAGVSIPMAVQHAQQAGWAEPNPTLDLDGTDAYAKAVIIHNLLFSSKDPLRLDGDRPRLNLEEERIRQLARSGRTPLVISTITPGRIALAVVGARAEGGGSDAVGLVRVRAVLRGGSEASIVGPGAGPRVTAGALMGDLRALSEGGEARPWGVIP